MQLVTIIRYAAAMGVLGGSWAPCLGLAADPAGLPGAITEEKSFGNGVGGFVGIRAWANSWDMPLGDTVFVVPNPLGPALWLQEVGANRVSSTQFSTIPFFGVRMGKLSATLTHSLKTSYTVPDIASGVKRSETDLALGYSIVPSVSVSAAYKYASIDRTLTDRATALAGGNPNPATVRALLLGVSGTVPLDRDWGLYGTFAYGPARTTIAAVGRDIRGDYRIAEFGFSRRLDVGGAVLKNGLTVTAGYRTQIVNLNDVPFRTYDATVAGFPEIANQNSKQTSTTQGLVFGLLGYF